MSETFDNTAEPGSIGYGQMGPNDMIGGEFNRVAFVVRQMMSRLDTAKLVQVVAVHAGSGDPPAASTVDVMPLVNQVDGNGNPQKHGTVYGIPCLRLQGGTNAIIVDPAVNDIGFVVAADRDTSLVRKNPPESPPANGVNPGSFRRFNIADGIYVGGCLNTAHAPTQYVLLNSDGIKILDKSNNTVLMSSSGITVTDKNGSVLKSVSGGFEIDGNLKVVGTLEATGVETGDAGLNVTGNITATGEVTAGQGTGDQVGLQTHTHTGVTTGGGTSGPPTPGS